MGKLQDKRIELAKKILDTTDPDKLAVVEDALNGTGYYQFSEAQIKEFEVLLKDQRSGQAPTYSWAEVKKRARARVGE